MNTEFNSKSNREKTIDDLQLQDQEEASLENIFCIDEEVSIKSEILLGICDINKYNSQRKNQTLDVTGYLMQMIYI